MKNFAVIHILLFILLMLVYQCADAQDYLITTKGDSIAGEIKTLFYGPEKKVQITTEDKKKTVYSIFQTRRFHYRGDIYQPVKYDRGYTFMKLIKGGYLSLYAFQMENQVNYDGLILVKKDGSKLEVPNLTFKKNMTKFLEDCGDVSEKIDKGELTKKNMQGIVDEYNACINTRTLNDAKVFTRTENANKKISSWDELENQIKAKGDFEGKADALEMVGEIKGKIKREEKVPNFMIEGLKSSLSKTDLTEALNKALTEIQN
jgi:hypothetical protein